MSESRFQRLERLFDEASSLDAAERDSFLDAACGDDPTLADEVRELLRHDSKEADSFKDALGSAVSDIVSDTANHRIGSRLGAWELTSHLSDGGMGSIYLAQRADGAFEQQAAVKLLNPAMLGEQAIRRLETERQILANLNHPNIASLLDGGTGSDGVPFLVLEYVDGQPIDRYCQEHNLTTRERLKLFRKVCVAVEYAHRNLVVHRDIKPSNILVQADGEPKLLDFGISKLLGDESPNLTRVDQRLFTPAHASPEQINGQTITTATDVYALGVLLYQLLAGRLPHASSPGETGAADSLALRILTEDPPAPSEAVTQADSERVAAQPGSVTASQLRRELAGELDNIAMMALRREPERRYDSVGALSLDVQRYLEDRPIQARPDSFGYRSAKLFKRRRGIIIAAAVMVVVVVGQSAFYFQRVIEERDTAEAERARAENVVIFMEELLQGADWWSLEGQEVTIEAILDRGAKRVETELAGQPVAQARLMHTIADTYFTLNRRSEAQLLVARVLALRREHLEPFHRDTLKAMHLEALLMAGTDQAGALAAMEELVALQREHLGPDDPDVALTLMDLSHRQRVEASFDDAMETSREAYRILSELPPEHPLYVKRASAISGIGNMLRQRNQNDAAIEAFEEVIRILDEAGLPHSATRIAAFGNIGGTLSNAGRLEEAEPYLLRAFELTEIHFGKLYSGYEINAAKLGRNYIRLGRLEEAETYVMIGLEAAEGTWGIDHPYYAYNLFNVARLRQLAGNHEQALEVFGRANDIYRESYGDYHPHLAASEVDEAASFIALGRYADAASQLEAVRARMLAVPDHEQLWEATARSLQGLALTHLGDWETAEPLMREAADDLLKLMGENHHRTQAANERLAQAMALTAK